MPDAPEASALHHDRLQHPQGDPHRRCGAVLGAFDGVQHGDHTGTHVDAFCHFDARPAPAASTRCRSRNFYTEAVCLDLSHTPLKGDIHIPDLEAAERKAGIEIRPRDTVLIYMGVHDRLYGKPGYTSDFPGLTKESTEWLGHKKITAFGVEAISPGTRAPTTTSCIWCAATWASPITRGWPISIKWSARAASPSSRSRLGFAAAPAARFAPSPCSND
ncbi:MAG: cyclase family protein [Pseudomonadota bacterium]